MFAKTLDHFAQVAAEKPPLPATRPAPSSFPR
jgi:hypothetical protein